jgi:hypothetical protein
LLAEDDGFGAAFDVLPQKPAFAQNELRISLSAFPEVLE